MITQRRHLQALGIALWQPRGGPAAAAIEPDSAPRAREVVEMPAPSEAPARMPPPPPAPPPAVAETPEPAPPQAPAAEPAPTEVADAVDVSALGWDELRAHVAGRSRGDALQAVFGVGAEDADLMVIGEAPGAEEDRVGEPFVGRAGKLLDAMLDTIGRSRARNVYIANICKFRPPNNRDPRPEEVAEDLPILYRQIALVQPRLILAVGRIAAHNLLGLDTPLGKMRGQDHRLPDHDIPVVVTYHPAYLLRSPGQKALAWQDLKRVRAHLEA